MTLFVYSPHDKGLRLEENFTSCVKTKQTQVSAGVKMPGKLVCKVVVV